jgi:hypothetical protein
MVVFFASIQLIQFCPHETGTTASALEFSDHIGKFFEATLCAKACVGAVPAQTGTIAVAF